MSITISPAARYDLELINHFNMKNYVLIIAFLFIAMTLSAQEEDDFQYGTYYTVKAGVGLNNQNWSKGLNRGLMFGPMVEVSAETYDSGSLSSIYASAGYHQRGSAISGFGYRNISTYRFHNLSVEFGGRRKAFESDVWHGYYLLGLRGEYTISHNLDKQARTSAFNIVDPTFVRRFNYGVTIGGGFEYEIIAGKKLLVELAFSPDLSVQYDQPYVIGPILNPFDTTRDIFVDPQQVRNYSLELRLGYKWLY